MHYRYEAPESRSIDLTPMLDVVFIMLIFFIVTATFVTETGLDLNPPEPANQPPPKQLTDVIRVSISSNNGIVVAGRLVDVRNLRPHLTRLHAQDKASALVILAHPNSDNGTMVAVMDAARLSGIADIKFAK